MRTKNNFDFRIDLSACWQVTFMFCLVAALMFLPSIEALASTSSSSDDGVSSVLCNIASKLSGPIGKGISTIAICVIGIGLFMGKLSWALALATAIGIGLIFSASKVVNWLSGTAGQNAEGCSTMSALTNYIPAMFG